ncbi:hypothetical protein A5790_05310 [Mycobacterium sp. 852002-51152_SCH6134967]|uniref:TIGR04255 family protein n=1 Tax=Mycobacterium sp. 852002-51152_SCH6134967 TaxID=1834096 RepID=UPI0007FEC935|nr:TIGR04255 family protein [Mycobacterium sp. 852002-51152_SCH6134967]OBF96448.1 hypothetical protein A5790_05310 [Mycobacterium sp. 852002-51152_SCH6134967]
MAEAIADSGDRFAKKRAPLIRVLSQLRWPVMSGFAVDSVADQFAVRIGKDYPLRETGKELGLLFTPEGVSQQAGGILHRFTDGDRQWVVTFAATFITLETSAYTTHQDFIQKLVAVVREMKDYLPLQRWDRFGYRYTNRITDEADISALQQLFNPAVLGTLALGFGDTIVHNVGETVYEGKEASLLVKSAYLPPGASIDATIPPATGPSYLLDLDAFATGPSAAFDDAAIDQQANVLAKKARDFFEKVTTDEYRARFAS